MISLYKNFNLLKLAEVYKLEFGKFMYQLHHRQLPQSFYDRFTKINDIHKYSTRQKYNSVYFKPQIKKANWKRTPITSRIQLMGQN